ncbi:MAG: hypothetical protein C0401_01545 [Anaerolinea sp.]|nr:hypothetical protein [Anaerolinea sp.]
MPVYVEREVKKLFKSVLRIKKVLFYINKLDLLLIEQIKDAFATGSNSIRQEVGFEYPSGRVLKTSSTWFNTEAAAG